MKDSFWAIPLYDEVVFDEEQQASKKQKCYDSELTEHGSLLNKAKNMPPIQAFAFLRDCKCCFTHQIDKPRELVKMTGNLYNIKLSANQQEKTCKCDCRHLSRMLCRGWDLSTLE